MISEQAKGTPSTVMQVLKQRVSRKLRRRQRRKISAAQLRFHFGAQPDSSLQFWQRRFYDFNVWSRKKKIEKLNYMHSNPVKRGLVRHPRDWPWSSFAFYNQVDLPLIPVDPS